MISENGMLYSSGENIECGRLKKKEKNNKNGFFIGGEVYCREHPKGKIVPGRTACLLLCLYKLIF